MTYPNLYNLKYYVDAVELGSISASAQKNHISHPAVSKAIQNLELHHDLKLITHKQKSFEITSDGYKFAKYAKSLLNQLENFDAEFKHQTQIIQGKITIGISRTLGSLYLDKIIRTINNEYPNLELKIHLSTTNELIEQLLHKNIDLSLTIDKISVPNLKFETLKTGHFILVGKQNKKFNAHEISTDTILTEPRYETELFKKEFNKKFKIHLKPKLEIKSWDMMSELVESGIGFGLIPDVLLLKYKKLQKIETPWFQSQYNIFLSHNVTENIHITKTTRLIISNIINKGIE